MGKVNAEWHKANPMPKNPTLAQRVAWHRAHAARCEMPENIRKLIEAEDASECKAGR